MTPIAERVRDEPDVDPEGDREQRQADLASQLPARAQVQQVVEGADDGGQRAAEQERGELARLKRNEQSAAISALSWRKTTTTTRNAVATAMPPPRGIGEVLTRRASGRSTTL